MTKIDLFSGFLGAGKTTLIKKLIQEGYRGEKLVLIENEFGEIGIDGGFLQDSGVTVNEMNSGCICCSLVGDFSAALKQVLDEYSPDRILIEPSGVGKLSDVIRAVRSLDDERVQLHHCCTVVDAKKCKMYMKNFGEFFNDQIRSAGVIVLSHTEQIEQSKLNTCLELIRSQNAGAAVVSTSLEQLTGEQLLEAMEYSLERELETLEDETKHKCGHHHDHDEHCGCHEHHHEHDEHCGCHEHHHADEVFTSWGRETVRQFSAESIRKALEKLDCREYGTVLRAKGIVPGENGTWIHFDYVPGEPDVRTGSSAAMGRLCVIGSDLNECALEKLFFGAE